MCLRVDGDERGPGRNQTGKARGTHMTALGMWSEASYLVGSAIDGSPSD